MITSSIFLIFGITRAWIPINPSQRNHETHQHDNDIHPERREFGAALRALSSKTLRTCPGFNQPTAVIAATLKSDSCPARYEDGLCRPCTSLTHNIIYIYRDYLNKIIWLNFTIHTGRLHCNYIFCCDQWLKSRENVIGTFGCFTTIFRYKHPRGEGTWW